MSYVVTEREYLEVGGIPLATPAWLCRSLVELWSGPAMRGTDRAVPGADGVRTWPWRPTVTDLDLTVDVVGDTDPSGAPVVDARVGLQANVDALRAGLVEAPTDAAGLRPATLHLPDGTTRTGKVRVSRFRVAELGQWGATVVLSLTLPLGRLV